MPPNQYLISLRLNEAKKLLESGYFSQKEIAEEIADITVGKINVDSESSLAAKFGIMKKTPPKEAT